MKRRGRIVVLVGVAVCSLVGAGLYLLQTSAKIIFGGEFCDNCPVPHVAANPFEDALGRVVVVFLW